MNIKRFNDSILESSNLESELLRVGYDNSELSELKNQASKGELGNFLIGNGKNITFGILNAIYKDCIDLQRKHEIKKGSIRALVRAIPIALSPLSLIVSYIGILFGSTRAVNKIIKPILADPGKSYPDFLKKIISTSMKIVEGEIDGEDPIKLAFVVSDGLVGMLSNDVILDFTIYQSDKMSKEDPDGVVPDYYIENELREYLNLRFYLNPELTKKK